MATAAAVVGGSALIGAYTSDKASKRAAQSQERAAETTAQAAAQARQDVLRLFPQAQQQLVAGAAGASDIFRRAMNQQQKELRIGNLGAQQTVGRGFSQAQQALLGLPIDPFIPIDVPSEGDPFSNTRQLLGNINPAPAIGKPGTSFVANARNTAFNPLSHGFGLLGNTLRNRTQPF